MPSTLLESQFAALQEPQADERPITVSIVPHPRDIVETIARQLGAKSATADVTGATGTSR
jgi:gluconate kinase